MSNIVNEMDDLDSGQNCEGSDRKERALNLHIGEDHSNDVEGGKEKMEASYSISVDENEVATKIEELDTPMEENLKDEIKHEEGSTLDLENEGENDAGGTMVNNDSGLQKFDKLLEEDTSEETKENEGNEYADSVEGEEKNEQESDKETNEDGPNDGQFPNEVITSCEDDVLQGNGEVTAEKQHFAGKIVDDTLGNNDQYQTNGESCTDETLSEETLCGNGNPDVQVEMDKDFFNENVLADDEDKYESEKLLDNFQKIGDNDENEHGRSSNCKESADEDPQMETTVSKFEESDKLDVEETDERSNKVKEPIDEEAERESTTKGKDDELNIKEAFPESFMNENLMDLNGKKQGDTDDTMDGVSNTVAGFVAQVESSGLLGEVIDDSGEVIVESGEVIDESGEVRDESLKENYEETVEEMDMLTVEHETEGGGSGVDASVQFVDETLSESENDHFDNSFREDASQFLEVDMADSSSVDLDNSDISNCMEVNISGEAVIEYIEDPNTGEVVETDNENLNEAGTENVKEIEALGNEKIHAQRDRKRSIQDVDEDDKIPTSRKSTRIKYEEEEEQMTNLVGSKNSSAKISAELKPTNKGKRFSTAYNFPASLPETPENIDDIIKQSSYFQNRKTLIKSFYPSSKQYDIVDEELPEGFKVWEQIRPNGKHMDKEFLTPDGRHILRSKLAVSEYCKVVLETSSEKSLKQDPQPSKRKKSPESLKGLKLFKEKVKRSLLKVSARDEINIGSGEENHSDETDNIEPPESSAENDIKIDCDDDFEMTDERADVPVTTNDQRNEETEISVVKCLPKGTKVKFTFVPETPETEKPTAKKYSCSLCKKIFLTRTGFDTHVVKDHKNARPVVSSSGKTEPPVKKLICSYCKQIFLNRTNFMRHIEQKHSKESKSEKNKVSTSGVSAKSVNRSFGNVTISVAQSNTPSISTPGASKANMDMQDGLQTNKGTSGRLIISKEKKAVSKEEKKSLLMKSPAIVKHPCQYCNRKFSELEDLESHKQFEHSFPCSFCTEVLPTKSKLAEHRRDSHNFVCNSCNKKFMRQTELEEHKRFEHFFPCPNCEVILTSKNNLLAHKKKEHSIKCMKCPATFDASKNLEEHVKKEHYFKCMKCPSKFEVKKGLEEHLVVEHYFHCEYCDMVYESRKSFQTHNELEHTFPCGECKEVFLTVELCSAHLKEKHQSCDDCMDEFSWPDLEHRCFFTKNNITPPSERVIEQNLYRGWFFNSTDSF